MKKFFVSILILFITNMAWSANWTVTGESPVTGDLKSYESINPGWIDLCEEKWQQYGYKNKDEWAAVINELNVKMLPKYLGKSISGKKITVVKAKAEQPAKVGLVIKFAGANYDQNNAVINITVNFMDGKTGKLLYKAGVSVVSKVAWSPLTGFINSQTMEAKLETGIKNLAQFIGEKIQ
jgi:hypothetical protein